MDAASCRSGPGTESRSAVAVVERLSSGPRSSAGTGRRGTPYPAVRSWWSVRMRASWRYRLGFTPSDPRTSSESGERPGRSKSLVERALPPVLERHRLLDRVEHLEPRREPGLERVLREDPLRERVQGGDRRRRRVDRSALVYGPSPPSAAASCSTCSRMRSCSSLAAAVVNVMTPSSSIGRVRRSPTTRSTSSWVLPVPAPATTFRVSPRSPRIRSRAAWSAGTGGSTVSCGWALTRPPGGHAARRRWLPSGRRASRRSPARGRASRGGRSRRTRTRRTS